MARIQQTAHWRFRVPLRRLWAAWCAAFACSANAAPASALDCTFSNVEATPWRATTPLTNATPVGSILYQRTVSLFVSYRYGSPQSTEHELVSAGHWLMVGSAVADGAARTNVDGIGFKWAGVADDGVERALQQGMYPVAFAKSDVDRPAGSPGFTNTQIARFRQFLVLGKPASQLPQGDLVVNDLPGGPTVALYAIDFPKGVASLGGTVTVPQNTSPPNLCKQQITYTGVGNLSIGGGGPIEVPNRCEVESNMIVPVNLGNFAISRFGGVNATSQPIDFSITLNQCAAAAKPTISFRDKAAQPNADNTLLQLSAPGGQPVAQGFNIVMTNALTGERIAYGEPGAAKQYPMRRTGDLAVMPLRAQYIRTGVDAELKAGYAGGAAEFTFTFP
ncbi:fimbrial protein [Burkholderia ubonensis]|nr:fimbrial protein [Burkholderia ubonensis]